MYYGARYYDRTVGLFVSPDTLVPDPTNVWDYNRYMYVRGNPLKYTDPTGHHAFCPTVGCSGMGMGERGGGGALLGRAAVSGAGVGVAAYALAGTAQDLVQEQDRYVTPAVEPAGATILDQPLPVTASASTSFPLADDGPETAVPPSTGVFNDTLNVLADPLPTSQMGSNVVFADYRDVFFRTNPQLQGKVVVHHAVEQQVLIRYPGLFTEAEIHDLSNLRGIPYEKNPDIHLSRIRKEWNRFYKQNPAPTKDEVLDFATKIDQQYGHIFSPTQSPYVR